MSEILSINTIEVEDRVQQFFMSEVKRIGQTRAYWRIMRGLLHPQMKIVAGLVFVCGAIGAMTVSVLGGLVTGAILGAITLIAPLMFYGGKPVEHYEIFAAYRALVLRDRKDVRLSLDEMCKQASAFNAALSARQHEDEALKDLAMYEDDVAQWHARREALSTKVDLLIDQLAVASRECMSAPDRRAEIATFMTRVERLKMLENGLTTLTPEEPTRGTKDYASFAVAAELRHRLEEEHQRLGLPASDLPPPKAKNLLKTAK